MHLFIDFRKEGNMARKATLEEFIDRCIGEGDLSLLLRSLQKAVCELVDFRLQQAFLVYEPDPAAKLVRLKASLMFAESSLRIACKARKIVVPNLAISQLIEYALRPGRV